ncbi:hypothetical protein KM918_14880 [Priestia megaterium]|uniref:hypothetical protein n=1 Tax=Priestia megaterium TaxID=1404 RepID=UPI001C24C8E7|nr:hypothetical protein [Priestia megaterium]MBU8688609.1 hypothetical protein [Priestia megaterium]
MERIVDILETKKNSLSHENQELLKKLIRKIKSFSTTPLNRKHCLRMAPFADSKEITEVVIETIQPYELKLLGDSCFPDYDSIGYHYCIALLACRVALNEVDELDVVTVLEHEVEKELKEHELVASRGGENYHVMLRIFKCFKKDTDRFNHLMMLLQNYRD